MRYLLHQTKDVTLQQWAIIAKRLHSASERQGFTVSYEEVLAKGFECEELILAHQEDQGLAGFCGMSAIQKVLLRGNFAEARVRYINGLIIEPRFGHQGLCTNLLRFAARRSDVVLAHTQSPFVVAAFRKAFPYVFPSPNCEVALAPMMMGSIQSFFESIGRPAHFDRSSGVVPACYGHALYQGSSSCDGQVVMGFMNAPILSEAMPVEVEHDVAA